MDDDLTLARHDSDPPRSGGRKRWEEVEARLDHAARRPAPQPVRRTPTALIVILTTVIVAATGFFGAPWLAFRAVRAAAEFGDAAALAEQIDYPAVRQSLRIQLRPASVEAKPAPDLLHDPIGALRRAWEPATPQSDVEPYLTPQALAALSEGREIHAKPVPAGGVFGGPLPRLRYWGFDRVRFGVADPAKPSQETLFVFQRRKLFDWRLVGVRLAQAGS